MSSHGSLKSRAKSELMIRSPLPALSGVDKSNGSARDSILPTRQLRLIQLLSYFISSNSRRNTKE